MARCNPAQSRTILAVDELESREVPSASVPTVDLSTLGATGSVNGALFRQYNSHGAHNSTVQSFLRLDDGGSERGYNTDARPLQFDESRNPRFTHSIRVNDIPLVTIGGVQYRELVLDVNEPGSRSRISLDELQLFVSNNPRLHGYSDRHDTLGGVRPVYDLGASNWVKMDAGLNHQVGTGDVLVDIPANVLSGGTYLALYSKFGTHLSANGSFEQWGPGFDKGPATQESSISGIAFFDYNGNKIYEAGSDAVAQNYAVSLIINGVVAQTVTTDSNGRFTFTVSLDASAQYTVQTNDYSSTPYSGTLNPGDHLTNMNLPLQANG